MPQLLIRADAETAEAFKARARAEGLTFGALLARLLSGAGTPAAEASPLEALAARVAALEARALAPPPAGPAKPQSAPESPKRREGEAEGLPAWVPSTGPELRELLAREGVSQGRLAERLGVSRPRVTALCRLEVLSPEMRGRLAEAIRAP